MPLARIERQWPGGPVKGTFTARYGPDNRFLGEYSGTVVAVTHDRYFLDNVVNWILELDRGKYFIYEGNYSTYLEKKAKRLEQEEREESGRQTAIRHELEWIRQGAKARQTKSKARIAKFDQLVAEPSLAHYHLLPSVRGDLLVAREQVLDAGRPGSGSAAGDGELLAFGMIGLMLAIVVTAPLVSPRRSTS